MCQTSKLPQKSKIQATYIFTWNYWSYMKALLKPGKDLHNGIVCISSLRVWASNQYIFTKFNFHRRFWNFLETLGAKPSKPTSGARVPRNTHTSLEYFAVSLEYFTVSLEMFNRLPPASNGSVESSLRYVSLLAPHWRVRTADSSPGRRVIWCEAPCLGSSGRNHWRYISGRRRDWNHKATLGSVESKRLHKTSTRN